MISEFFRIKSQKSNQHKNALISISATTVLSDKLL